MPDQQSPLGAWLTRFGVRHAVMAAWLEMTPNYISQMARGDVWPSDNAKLRIEQSTAAHERSLGVTDARGVTVEAWAPVLRARALDEAAAANGGR